MAGIDYSNWLVASDVDGTLNTKFRKLHPKNKKAAQEFMAHGGNFMLASGRPVASLARAYRRVNPNCPCAVLNGSGIYDFEKQEFIWKQEIGAPGKNFVRRMIKKYSGVFHSLDVGVFGKETVYIIKAGAISLGQVLFDRNAYLVADVDEVPDDEWLKVVFWSNPVMISRLKKDIAENEGVGTFMSTSPFTVEMCEYGVHKGTAVMKMAEMKNVKKENVAAIGDYYNDRDMLKSVGFPACAGQAPMDIHEICRLVACHCNKGCVAELINIIMDVADRRSAEPCPA